MAVFPKRRNWPIERKIPYQFIGGTGLLQAAHVKDLFALIRSIASHRDELAWMRYLTLWPRIGDRTAVRYISDMAQQDNTGEALQRLRAAMHDRNDLLSGLEAVQEHWDDPSAAIRAAAHSLDSVLKPRYDKWDQRRKDFELLASLATRFKSLLAFLETYTLDPISTTEAERLEGEDAVTLITVHSAKGTEAPVCYVIRAEPRMYPHVRSLGKQDEEEEERRVLYVTMTRAQNELILTRTLSYGSTTTLPGGFQAQHSPGGSAYFLEGLPDNLVETQVFGWDLSPLAQATNVANDDVIIPISR